jgi:hypothetical protein
MSSVLTLNGGVLVSNGVAVSHEGGSSANIQEDKTYTVSASGNQTISPDSGYDAMDAVALSVPAGSAGTPSATKGTVSNHAVSVTPSVTNTTGWITGEIKSGTAVSVSASELVSGTYSVTSSGTKDVTNYASASVPSGTATAPASISGTSASVSTGTNTLTLSKTVSVTPNVSTAGYISSGTAGNSSVSLTADVNIQSGMLSSYAPSTTAQTISANTYLPNTVTFLPVTTTNLIADNIKKGTNVKVGYSANAGYIANITGTYEGSGGTTTLKMGVVRPDAELLQTWSADYLLHADKNITIPSYSTTATTLLTGGTALTPTVTLSNANYRYYLLQRFLTIPQYSITTLAKGRQEYTAMSMCYEIVAYPANTFSALINTTKYASRNTAMIPAGNAFVRNIYWSSASALSVYTANTYGCAQTIQTAPAISSGTAASPTLTVYTPNATIRGSTTYLVNTFYNAITDIRCQYVIELYRVPASTASTYGIDGWGHYTQMLHNITCAQSSTHKLS